MLTQRLSRYGALTCSLSRVSRVPQVSLHLPHFAALRKYATATALSTSSETTPIEKIILDTIKVNGPISLATYINLCLSHPIHGYYMNPSNEVFGTQGDFITSPEISQIFGELVGVWLLSQYMSNGVGMEIRLVELGPGRGTLMDDILRTLSQFPASRSLVKQVHLVETSPALRAIQEKKLQRWSSKSDTHNTTISWHESIDDISSSEDAGKGVYTMLVAHEFFDALPVHLIEKTHQGWKEVLLSSTPDPIAQTRTVLRASDLNIQARTSPPSPAPNTTSSSPSISASTSSPVPGPTQSPSKPRLRPVLSPTASPISTLLGNSSPRFTRLPVGSRIEVSAAGFQISRKVGEMLGGIVSSPSSQPSGVNGETGEAEGGKRGCALVIDYGDDKAVGNSFRAFKEHKIVDPFVQPGMCDLTANVDFAYLKEAMVGTGVHSLGPLPQSTFLNRMGLNLRLAALTKSAPEDRKDVIEKAAQRLVDKTGMGREYKVLGIVADGLAGPEGNVDGQGGKAVTGDRKGEDVWPFVEGVGDGKL